MILVTKKISFLLEPLFEETLDHYLFRAVREKEVRNQMLEIVKEELKEEYGEEIRKKLEDMKDILEGAGTKYFYGPGIENQTWLELIATGPVIDRKPDFE